MSLYRMTGHDYGKQKKLKKAIPSQSVANDFSPQTDCKHGDSIKEYCNQKLVTCPDATAGQSGDGKLPTWHYVMEQTFESFLLRLDEIFLTLRRRDSPQASRYTNLKNYQDICEKLRMEILIAMDKLELLSMPNCEHNHEHSEFLNKMSKLKTQLSELRWQYHNAINDLGAKMM